MNLANINAYDCRSHGNGKRPGNKTKKVYKVDLKESLNLTNISTYDCVPLQNLATKTRKRIKDELKDSLIFAISVHITGGPILMESDQPIRKKKSYMYDLKESLKHTYICSYEWGSHPNGKEAARKTFKRYRDDLKESLNISIYDRVSYATESVQHIGQTSVLWMY